MEKIIIAEGFEEMTGFIRKLPEVFKKEGFFLRKSRNQLKVIEVNNVKLCIKKFGRPTLANIFIYSFFRKTKAERSFLFARKLLQYGIHTPQPIGYIEFKNKWAILKQSYYICIYEESLFTMNFVFNNTILNKEKVIKQFVDFAVDGLHANGVFHKDFNGANTMVSKDDKGNYQYSVVDLNRIKFNQKMGHRKSIKHLTKTCSDPYSLAKIGEFYANKLKEDSTQTSMEMIAYKYISIKRRRTEKKFLHGLKNLFTPLKTQRQGA